MTLGEFLAAFLTGAAIATCAVVLVTPDPPTLTDRQVVITVEEDGSYPAGCVTGWLCDDQEVQR